MYRPPLENARALLQQGQHQQALPLLRAAASAAPSDPQCRLLLCECLVRCGLKEEGLALSRRTLADWADNDSVFAAACYMIAGAGGLDESIDRLIAAAANNPGWLHVRCRLSAFYSGKEQFDLSAAVAREALAIAPGEAQAAMLLARACGFLGQTAEASRTYARAIQFNPGNHMLAESHAFMLNNHSEATRDEVFRAHQSVGAVYALHAAPQRFSFPATDDPDRTLRVGLVSHDLNNHSVASFAEPLLRHLDRSRFVVVAYFTSRNADSVTERLRTLADEFVHVPNIPSLDLARRVHADRIDVLIDLNGLTVGHRLHTFQLKPAPVQMTWLGYPNTTGLSTIDYRIVDSITDPPGAEQFATERLLRIDPCFICYTPVTERPEALGKDWTPPPPRRTGSPVFGSFNNAAKVSDQTIECWAGVMEAIPEASLLVKAKGMIGTAGREGMLRRLTVAGIAPQRISVMPQTASIGEHLALYSQVDIALDTMPYNGTTTTCESLLMGVPVLTAAGDRHAARVSASILNACGLSRFVAQTPDELPRLAASLAGDIDSLRSGRDGLAEAFRRSTACDGIAFAVRFGDALSKAWRERCAVGVQRLPGNSHAQ